MESQVAYTKTPLAKIGTELDKLFVDLGNESHYARAASANMLILVSEKAGLELVEHVIDLLSQCHPSRFFVIEPEGEGAKLSAEIAARCHLVSKGQHLCSEVVRLHVPREALRKLPSIVQANSVTGSVSELMVLDGAAEVDALAAVLPLVDRVIFDSELFGERFFSERIAERALRRPVQLVDLQWVALRGWRDQIRSVFARPALEQRVSQIREITVRGGADADNPPLGVWLLAGWFMDRLGLSADGMRQGAFRTRNVAGDEVLLSLDRDSSQGGESVSEVEIRFAQRPGEQQRMQVRIWRGIGLETEIMMESGHKYFSSFEEEDLLQRIRHFFTIGVAIGNYPSSLRAAVVLEELWRRS